MSPHSLRSLLQIAPISFTHLFSFTAAIRPNFLNTAKKNEHFNDSVVAFAMNCLKYILISAPIFVVKILARQLTILCWNKMKQTIQNRTEKEGKHNRFVFLLSFNCTQEHSVIVCAWAPLPVCFGMIQLMKKVIKNYFALALISKSENAMWKPWVE